MARWKLREEQRLYLLSFSMSWLKSDTILIIYASYCLKVVVAIYHLSVVDTAIEGTLVSPHILVYILHSQCVA